MPPQDKAQSQAEHATRSPIQRDPRRGAGRFGGTVHGTSQQAWAAPFRFRAKWTRQRWWEAPWKQRLMAATRPVCWSEMTNCTPGEAPGAELAQEAAPEDLVF